MAVLVRPHYLQELKVGEKKLGRLHAQLGSQLCMEPRPNVTREQPAGLKLTHLEGIRIFLAIRVPGQKTP